MVILKYESVRNTIIKHNFEEILQAFINTNNRRKKELNISPDIYYEKVIMIFNKELDNLNNKKKKRKKNKKRILKIIMILLMKIINKIRKII